MLSTVVMLFTFFSLQLSHHRISNNSQLKHLHRNSDLSVFVYVYGFWHCDFAFFGHTRVWKITFRDVSILWTHQSKRVHYIHVNCEMRPIRMGHSFMSLAWNSMTWNSMWNSQDVKFDQIFRIGCLLSARFQLN